MEFKGTKENWVVLAGYKSCGVSMGNRSTMVFSNDCEEDLANALLISKAPEMLELLIQLRDTEDFGVSEWQQINNLIKQATEI